MASTGEIARADGEEPKPTIVAKRGQEIMAEHQFISFKGRCMVLAYEPYPHYVALQKDSFSDIAYAVHGGLTRGQVNDLYDYVKFTAEKRDEYAHYISFGISVDDAILHPELNDYDIEWSGKHKQMIWDTQQLCWLHGEDPALSIWRCPYPRGKAQEAADAQPLPFIMSLAGGDKGLYDDIMQSIAPIIMDKKPDGLIWWVGNGANGKSTLMDALYRLFPGQLAGVNVKALEDGRDTPHLNNALANIVKESSEGRVEDTERYKCLGTHENFWVHKFHSQEGQEINGNIHTIFNANSIPAFNDKGHSAKRRTFIIPFNQVFRADPDFEAKTFTADFFARLVAEMAKYAQQLKKQGYRYKWSPATAGAKEEYDKEANNAEQYVKEIMAEGLVAFSSYHPVRMDYDNWCADNGYVPLGVTYLRKAMRAAGFDQVSHREGSSVGRIYRLLGIDAEAPLEPLSLRQPGLFTTSGFYEPLKEPDPEPLAKAPEQTTILNHKW